MTIKNTIKALISQTVRELYQLNELDFSVDYPPQQELGDYSSNAALLLAKKLKKNPLAIAEQISASLGRQKFLKPCLAKIETVKPGFINFYLAPNWVSAELKTILKPADKFGQSAQGKGKKIVLDYSAPNIAKKMHVGHLRSTVIGAALYNIYKFQGYTVIRDNHLGDWGTQFGKLIVAYKSRYGNKIKKNIGVEELEEMYLAFHAKAKSDPRLDEQARVELKKLQSKDRFNFKLWQLFYRVSLDEFKKVYKVLGVDFDLWQGESFYNDQLAGIVSDALKKGAAEKSQGAIIIDLHQFNLPPFMIQKSDGAYLYTTTDLATIIYRRKKFKPEKNLYVVASQQSLHFEQLFKASQLLGYGGPMAMEHIKFGLILGRDGKKMSTREGGAVDLLEIIEQGVVKAKKIILQKNKSLAKDELEAIAKIVALGAIKYNDLAQNRLTDITFDWDKMLVLDSGSSPYLQYTYVRIMSIFKKAGRVKSKFKAERLTEESEISLIKTLLKFPEAVDAAAAEYKPNLIAAYLEDLARNFHSFYEQVNVLKAEAELKTARLNLIKATAQVMKSGLALLGIDCPEKM